MIQDPVEWRLSGLRDYFAFVHNKMPDHNFAWVLGAGASRSSGIPTGAELVDRWLRALHSRVAPDEMSFEEWATSANLAIEGFEFEHRSWFYPQVYQRCFRDHPDEGYAFLEDSMAAKDPSPGYSILAKILEATRHRVVITTNFDNLVADALAIYTETFPFVCGHEALAGFVRVSMRRPLVCKIHRDLLLRPQNDPRSLKRLHDSWGSILRLLLHNYTPIFIGYGGNDDTLMDLLESIDPEDIKGQLIWCYYEGGERPKTRIRKLVAQHNGALVAVPDFDLLMVLLGAAVGIAPLDEVIETRASERAAKYRERIIDLDTSAHPEIRRALAETFERGGWKVWVQKANEEKEPERKREIYERALSLFAENSDLLLQFAWFLQYERDDPRAEEWYRRARNVNPEDPVATGHLGLYLDKAGRHDDAENMYRRAIDLNPTDAFNLANYAHFLATIRKRPVDAERHYRRALRASTGDAALTLEFAIFLGNLEGKEDEAETYFSTSLHLDPNRAQTHAHFGRFLSITRDNLEEAGKQYRAAIECDNADLSHHLELAAIETLQDNIDVALAGIHDASSDIGTSIENQVRWTIYLGVVNCVAKAGGVTGKDDADQRLDLEALLGTPFERHHFDMSNLRKLIEKRLPSDSRQYYSLVADALQNEEAVEAAFELVRRKTKKRRRKTSVADERGNR